MLSQCGYNLSSTLPGKDCYALDEKGARYAVITFRAPFTFFIFNQIFCFFLSFGKINGCIYSHAYPCMIRFHPAHA